MQVAEAADGTMIKFDIGERANWDHIADMRVSREDSWRAATPETN